MTVNVDAAVRWYRKRIPGASVEQCVEIYERALASSREAKRRRRRRVRGNPPTHGTLNGYRNYGCRCDACRAAGSVANAYYAKRRAQEAS